MKELLRPNSKDDLSRNLWFLVEPEYSNNTGIYFIPRLMQGIKICGDSIWHLEYSGYLYNKDLLASSSVNNRMTTSEINAADEKCDSQFCMKCYLQIVDQ